jgi:hypothetical protein
MKRKQFVDLFCLISVFSVIQFILLISVFFITGCNKRPKEDHRKSIYKEVIQTQNNSTESSSIDVGDVYRGGTVARVFVYENKSGKKQTIAENGIKKSCTCSSLTVDKQVLEPGEKTDIHMSVTLADKYGRFDEMGIIIWKAVDESIPIQRYVVTVSGNAVAGFEFTPNELIITKEDVLSKKELKIKYERLLDMERAEVHVRLGHHALTLYSHVMPETNKGVIILKVNPDRVNDTIFTSMNIWSHVRDQYSGKVNTIMGSLVVRIENPEIVKCMTSSLKLRKLQEPQSGYKGYLMFRGGMSNVKILELAIANKKIPISDVKHNIIKIANVVYRLDIEIPKKPEYVVDRNQCRLHVKLSNDLVLDLPVDFQ